MMIMEEPQEDSALLLCV